MKFFKFIILAAMLSTVLTACQKDKTVISPTADETSAQKVSPIAGNWTGIRLGIDRSIPIHFGLQIKNGGKLDVLDKDRQVIGRGDWSFENQVLRVHYSLLSNGEIYRLKGEFFDQPNQVAGSWGFDDNETNGGDWQLTKID